MNDPGKQAQAQDVPGFIAYYYGEFEVELPPLAEPPPSDADTQPCVAIALEKVTEAGDER
jgi:hypothetical protein